MTATAYEQLMASLDERVRKLEGNVPDRDQQIRDAVSIEFKAIWDSHCDSLKRLDSALSRIEGLERELARLKGPHSHPELLAPIQLAAPCEAPSDPATDFGLRPMKPLA